MLTKLKKSNAEGFTIIEVMIVLAIAGLIMLIVFLAIPALQRNSRNTQRKNDAAAYAAAVSEDTNNNNGTLTTGTGGSPAVNDEKSKAGQLTTLNYNVSATGYVGLGNLVDGTAYIRNFSTCATPQNGTGQEGLGGGTQRQVTVTYLVESPGASVSGVQAGFVPQCVTAS